MLGQALTAAGLTGVSFTIENHNMCLIDVDVNGASGKMILDTGATFAGVDSRVQSQMNVRAYSSHVGSVDAAGVTAETKLAHLNSFRIGGVPARAPDIRMGKFAFYDTSGGKIIGLLGIDILGPNGSIIDFGQRKLFFYPGS